MIGDDRDDPLWRQTIAESGQRPLEDSQFIVDRDAHRLEERREVRRPAAWSEDGADRAHQIIAGAERAVTAASHDLARQSPGFRFVRVLTKDPDQFVLIGLVEESRRIGIRIGAHAHVERRTWSERESSGFFVDLVRRDPQVEENAIPYRSAEFRVVLDVGEVGANGFECAPALVFRQAARGGIYGRRILIDSSDVGAPFEEGEGVSASSERTVQNVPSVAEQLGDLAGENRRVKGWDDGNLGHRNAVNLVSSEPVRQVFGKLRVVQPG